MKNTNIRVVNTQNLKGLIRTAEVLGLNQYPDIRSLDLDEAGFHILELLLEDHKGFTNRDVIHHRVSVLAKVWQRPGEPMKPAEFLLDVRAQDWDELIDAESMNRALDEFIGQLEGIKDKSKSERNELGRRTKALFS
ncbi:MAG: hypothetical protein EBT07_13490 [Actinobacteria bacterium]|nr:hypothetical protein [Actinomycetota bacterium]